MKTRDLWITMSLVVLCGLHPALADSADDSRTGSTTAPTQGAKAKPTMAPYGFPTDQRLGTLPEGLGIAIGQRAPDAELHDADGHPAKLLERLSRGPILVVFYRGGWCPFCNAQIHDLVTSYPDFQKRGITPVAVSVDRIEEASKISATYTIPFPVLSDPDLTAIHSYRVAHPVDESERGRLTGFGIDLEHSSGRDHHVIAIPSLFLIDREGIVRWAHADPDYKVRPSTAQILAAIDRIGLASH